MSEEIWTEQDTKKISVVINTYNAQEHLSIVLDSVKGFDEILICDMESTDNTLKIANDYGCKIVTFKKGEHRIVEPARNFAIESAKYPWVLVVDADEIVPKTLKDYLYKLICEPNPPAGLFIPRRNYYNGKFMHCNYPDKILRFFKKEGTFWPPKIHSTPQIDGIVAKIPDNKKELAFIHLANETISNRVNKNNTYTEYELERKMHRNFNGFSLIYRPFFKFFKGYILKKGYKDGVAGFIRSCDFGYYEFILIAKIIEHKKLNNNSKDLEKDIKNSI